MKVGINIVPQSMDWFGLPKKQTLQKLMALPFSDVRIAIRMRDVWLKKNHFDFGPFDGIIETLLKHNKSIHLQLGIKTLAWPEVHPPLWLEEAFPLLTKSHQRLDKELRVQQHILKYAETVGNRYFPIKEIASIQIENEPFSKRLQVSNYRYLSPHFTQQEVALVKKLDPYKRPLVQNIPLDTPLHIRAALAQSDILGLNVYPQAGAGIQSKLFWPSIQSIFATAKILKKPIWVTEYQAAAWLNDNKKPAHLFDPQIAQQGLEKLKKFDPGIIFLWDTEQLVWRNEKVSVLLT